MPSHRIRTFVTALVEVVCGSLAPLGVIAYLLWNTGAAPQKLLVPVGAVIGLGFAVGIDRAVADRAVFSNWPVPRDIGSILAAAIGYSGVVAIASVVGIVVSEATSYTTVGILVAGVGSVWFFKHLVFLLSLDEPTDTAS